MPVIGFGDPSDAGHKRMAEKFVREAEDECKCGECSRLCRFRKELVKRTKNLLMVWDELDDPGEEWSKLLINLKM